MKKYLPILAILIAMCIVYVSGANTYFSYENLQKYHSVLKKTVDYYPILSPFIYILIYTLSTALSIPGGLFLSLLGGFLFPQPLSTIYVLIGATTGATLLFIAAKTALHDLLQKKAGPQLKKFEKGFSKNAASYLLFLRLVPLFPFWLVNLAPAFFNVSLFTFIWTTLIGILPGAFVFTQAGAGLSTILESHAPFSLNTIFNTQMKIALVALALFVLLPVVIKHLRPKKLT